MRIVHLGNHFQPRLGYQEYYLAREQSRCGHDVIFVTSDRHFPYPDYDEYMKPLLGNRIMEPGTFVEEGVKVIRLGVAFERYHQIWLRKLDVTIEKLRPDVVHMHNCGNISALRIGMIKRKLNFRLLCDEHSHLSVMEKRNSAKRSAAKIYKIAIRNILKKTDSFAAIAPDVKDVMVDVFGLPRGRINIIPLGVETNSFHFCERSRNEIRQTFDIGDNISVIVYAGKLIPDKGPHLLVEAALDILRNRRAELRVLLIGDGNRDYIDAMKERIRLLKLDDFFIWHGFADKKMLYKFYSAADIGVWPLEESISMLEASACKLPIIVKDSESLRDRISSGNGLSYHEGDTESLQSAILKIIGDKDIRWEMGKKALRLVEERYSWKNISERFLRLYGQTTSSIQG